MPIRTRPVDRGIARGRTLVLQLCRELEEARLDRGLSYAALGRPLGLSGQQVGRICRGRSPNVSVARLAQLFSLAGLELAARGYVGGQPLRDAGHVALLRRFRSELGPALQWRTEVPLLNAPSDGSRDVRAWDATVSGPTWTVGVEAETHLRDWQAVERRLAMKARDGDVSNVILLLSATRHHRELIASVGDAIGAAFPTSTRDAMRALRRGEPPANNSLVLL